MKKSEYVRRRMYVKRILKGTKVNFNQFKSVVHREFSNNANKYAGNNLRRKNTIRRWIRQQKSKWRIEK